MVMETMQKEKLSYSEAARHFEINNHKRVAARERIYLEEGQAGLTMERRSRRSKDRLPKEIEEDVLTEVQRIQAENVYLWCI